jgi:transcriptional regulator with XRE-family HTH domain
MTTKRPTYPNHLRAIRRAINPKMTLEKFAELTELSVGYLSKLEAGKQPLNTRIMTKIAKALGVKPSELIDSSTAWLEIDITGVISDDYEIKPVSANGTGRHNFTTSVPAALVEHVAALVMGNSLYPRYDDQDIITYTWQGDDVSTAIGKECVVLLTDGRIFLRTVIPGGSENTYHLTSYNAQPLYNVTIAKIGRVSWVGRAQ